MIVKIKILKTNRKRFRVKNLFAFELIFMKITNKKRQNFHFAVLQEVKPGLLTQK